MFHMFSNSGSEVRGPRNGCRGALFAGAALLATLSGSSGAWAQCRDDFNLASTIAGVGLQPVQRLVPLGTGPSLQALTSTINTVNTAFLTGTSAFVSAPGGAQPDQQGGGVWGRAIAGTVDTSTSSVGILTQGPINAPGFVPTGTQHCNTTASQDFWGYQVGHDISILNGGGTGANWHWGVTAGYVASKTKDTTPGGAYQNPNFPAGIYNGIAFNGTFVTPPGTFNADTIVPFVGIYTAFTKGNFYLDGQARWDFYRNELTDANNGLRGQELDAQGFSLTGNIGYNIPLHNNWFIEPSGGAVWSRVRVDPLSVAGQVNVGGTFARGTVTVDDINSVLGRLSLRVGTTVQHAGIAWQPYFTASVFHEFSGDVTAASVSSNNVDGGGLPNDNINGIALVTRSEGGVGTYGQFALGTAAVLGNSGWLGYGRVDYRIGENIEGWSVNAGLRYQFTPEAGRSIKDSPSPARYAYNWTGPYIGAFVGTAWGGQDWSTPFGGGVVTHDNPELGGYLAGGQVGYNLQFGRTVVGIEGDYGFSNSKGGGSCDDAGGAVTGLFDFTCQGRVDSLATLTARLGYTWGRALFYVKGGLATGEVRVETKNNLGLPVPPSGTPVNGETNWQTGWTVGGGMEFALTDRWSAKAEYLHYDLGSDSFAVDSGLVAKANTDGNIARIGVNLHFNPVQREALLK